MDNKRSKLENPYQVANRDCDGLFPDTRKNGAIRVLCKLAVNGDQRINRKLDLIMQQLGLNLKRSLHSSLNRTGTVIKSLGELEKRNKWTDTNMESQAVKHDWKKAGIPLLIFFGVIGGLLVLGLVASCVFGCKRWDGERGAVGDVEKGQRQGGSRS